MKAKKFSFKILKSHMKKHGRLLKKKKHFQKNVVNTGIRFQQK